MEVYKRILKRNMEIKNIAVHHFGAPNPNLTLKQLNNAHKSRWPDFPSKLRPDLWVGYNFVVWADGSYLQARYIGEETAAQRGYNNDTVSICLEGDFSRGRSGPTEAQQKTLKWLVNVIIGGNAERYSLAVNRGTTVNISPKNIHPHRFFQKTECYGTGLSDDWAKLLVYPETPIKSPSFVTPPQSEGVQSAQSIWERIRVLQLMVEVLKLKELLDKYQQRRMGAVSHSCWDEARG